MGIQQSVLKFSRDKFFIVSYHFTVLCTGHSAKKTHNRFSYRARLRENEKVLQMLALSSAS